MYLKPKIKRLGKSYKGYVQQTSPKLFLPTRNLNEHFGTSALRIIDLIAIFHICVTIARDVGPSKSLLRTSAKGKSCHPSERGAVSVIYNPHPHPTLPREKNDINKN